MLKGTEFCTAKILEFIKCEKSLIDFLILPYQGQDSLTTITRALEIRNFLKSKMR